MQSLLLEAARHRDVVVLVGAGVSAIRPTALPGWNALNEAIVQVLRRRLEGAIQKPNWVQKPIESVGAAREDKRFPPEYQAQLIEEMCGERYFRALQALDVDVVNAAHEALASLAAAGCIKAVVTTNFDRLVEHAMKGRRVTCTTARGETGFKRVANQLRSGARTRLPIVKIHGCVSRHESMIDTLKQRKLGRSKHLEACLEHLHSSYWIYLGFSAGDLDGDDKYLGLVAGAARSRGATFVAYPPRPELGKGALCLMEAHGLRARIVIQDSDAFLAGLCDQLGVPAPRPEGERAALGMGRFQRRLEDWADELSGASAGLCLAAVLEGVGQGEAAVRVLDRIIRDELREERGSADFRAVQLHYGRLGGAWGRFLGTSDLGGAESNASVETFQSLARIQDSEVGFATRGWMTLVRLWRGEGEEATKLARDILISFHRDRWPPPGPRNDEESVDAWCCAAQVFVVNDHRETIKSVLATADAALFRARRCGDVVRAARVHALRALALAGASKEDTRSFDERSEAEFAEAGRVGDRFALGMRRLAVGRWHVGPGGLALGLIAGSESVARSALEHLQAAVEIFRDQGMHPWVAYAVLQEAKAFIDLGDIDRAQECVDSLSEFLKRFPVWRSHANEVVAQARMIEDRDGAQEAFRMAITDAERTGLAFRAQRLRASSGTSA